MLRLVQGDVGCGKTVVAALAAARAAEAGFQTAVMAPTELLAEQHGRNFSTWFAAFDLPLTMLTGKRAAAARTRALTDLASGAAKIAIGTHALFQEGVEFERLGLVIVDEQHRFGVHQRLLLREKGRLSGRFPHQLIMTATPIPRTLAMTAYADLDVSIIDELPPGRTPVKTVALIENRRDEVVVRIRDACRQKRQAYWVCPLVEESDQLSAQAAEETATALAEALPELTVALVHGRMAPREKEAIMARFKEGKVDLLVATTVIEVGVDVRSTNDGFEISRRDLELRGPGEMLGTRQTGLMQMRVADLVRDADLLPQVQQAAELMMRENEANIAPLLRRWTGQGERFGKV